ncbi:hypothetical protein HHI36_002768, partial [Cryptolaemus montrouzieri]
MPKVSVRSAKHYILWIEDISPPHEIQLVHQIDELIMKSLTLKSGLDRYRPKS